MAGDSLLPVQYFSHFRKQGRRREGLLEKVNALALNAFVNDDISRVAAHENCFDPWVGTGDFVEGFLAVFPRHHHVKDDEVYLLVLMMDSYRIVSINGFYSGVALTFEDFW